MMKVLKVTVCFEGVKVMVPCSDNCMRVKDLMKQASMRYKKAVSKNRPVDVFIYNLKSSDGGILDEDDTLCDVIDNRETVFATFKLLECNDVLCEDEEDDEDQKIKLRGDGRSSNETINSELNPMHKHANNYPRNEDNMKIDGIRGDNHFNGVYFKSQDQDVMLRQTSEPLLTVDNMNSGSKPSYADSFLDNDTTYSTNCNNCSQDDTILSVKRFDRASKRYGAEKAPCYPPMFMFDRSSTLRSSHLNKNIQPFQRTGVRESQRRGTSCNRFNSGEISEVRVVNDGQSLGIHVIPCYDRIDGFMGLLIQKVDEDGKVYANGSMFQDDVIIEINGVSLEGIGFERSQLLLKNAICNSQMVLTVKYGCDRRAREKERKLFIERNYNFKKLMGEKIAYEKFNHEKMSQEKKNYEKPQQEMLLLTPVKNIPITSTPHRNSTLKKNKKEKYFPQPGEMTSVEMDKTNDTMINKNNFIYNECKAEIVDAYSKANMNEINNYDKYNKNLLNSFKNSNMYSEYDLKNANCYTPKAKYNNQLDKRFFQSKPATCSKVTGLTQISDLDLLKNVSKPKGRISFKSIQKEISLIKGPQGLGFSLTTCDDLQPSTTLTSPKPIYVKHILPRGAAKVDGRLMAGDILLQVDGLDVCDKRQEEVVAYLRSLDMNTVVTLLIERIVPVHDTDPVFSSVTPLSTIDPSLIPSTIHSTNTLELPSTTPSIQSSTTPYQNHHGVQVVSMVICLEENMGIGISVRGKTKQTANGEVVDLGLFVKGISKGGGAYIDGRMKEGDRILEVNGRSLVNLNNQEAREILRLAMLSQHHKDAVSFVVERYDVANPVLNPRSASAKLMSATPSAMPDNAVLRSASRIGNMLNDKKIENRYSMVNNLMKNNNIINYDCNSIKSIKISENFFNSDNVDLISTNEMVVSRSVSRQSQCAEKENYPPKKFEKQGSNLNANNLKKFDEDNDSVWSRYGTNNTNKKLEENDETLKKLNDTMRRTEQNETLKKAYSIESMVSHSTRSIIMGTPQIDTKACGFLKKDNLKRVKSIENLVKKYSLGGEKSNKKGFKGIFKNFNLFKSKLKTSNMPEVMVTPLKYNSTPVKSENKTSILNSIKKFNTPSKYTSQQQNNEIKGYGIDKNQPYKNPFNNNNFYKI